MTETVMLQGTASGVGKSVLATALCKILRQDGYQVAPFKSQNMALNSYPTKQGGEIGRAQAVQAEAAGVEASVDMNPILLKPQADDSSQVIIHGQAVGNLTAQEYFSDGKYGLEAIKTSLTRLKNTYQLVVIEGAGSPAEINLREVDRVNMKVAHLADAPVILVADIERGGVFADIVGTFELLNQKEVARIKGIIINKFHGEISRLQPGIDYIEEELGVPVLGVIPYFNDFKIPEEDSIASYQQGSKDYKIKIGIIKLPHMSNFTDFTPLGQELETKLVYLTADDNLADVDLVILPGSKNTIDDLKYLYQKGWAAEIKKYAAAGKPVIGICGGYQMLGEKIYDPQNLESNSHEIKGLGLLEIETTLVEKKVTKQVKAKTLTCLSFLKLGQKLSGYEIHLGQTRLKAGVNPIFQIIKRGNKPVEIKDGAVNQQGNVWGSYLHGLFDNGQFRRQLINHLRVAKGLNPLANNVKDAVQKREKAYKSLAELVRENIDLERLYKIMALN